jgi:hypothetical protein
MSNPQLVCQQTRNKVSITVVSNDQVRVGLQLSGNLMCHILKATEKYMNCVNLMKHYKQPDGKLDAYIGVSFQVRPDFKT